ncbi:uncharacterized membrane-anchored protein YitT (DUF2179 family) [Dysgonomonas sp. PH5-45]|uniref:YitT family protein n=1 Tax=unclassified Dysgonomonas TaxID=2630389 RepID=UPI002476991F|nr:MULTISPECIES: YitT family protein [unclassified Dysgonomonas]MDH6354851.1 uncharacterized membrane-anchored protein YitT (DUF2179 family) [Dysgonomonas sp. PH5-45]MDH6387750.1 uncharacterized membrane-anchored protein YitT (DUF2179 family) [Dysgonomonas sp. PH5-37]
MEKNKYLKDFYWKDYMTITIGLVLYAVGLIGFVVPGDIVTGGLAGIALLIEYATNKAVPLQVSYFVINVALLSISLKILGLKFLVKTIYGVVMLTSLLFVARMVIPAEGLIDNEPLLAGLIGGLICGTGIGLVFSANGSAGGTDIIVAVVNKYKNLAFGRGMLLCDFCIISCSYFIFGDTKIVVASLIVMVVMTYMIDIVINGSRQSVQFLIFSDKYDVIADAINKEMHRGCTILDGTGWYSKKPTKVILMMAKRSESVSIFRMIKSIDEKAFISQSTVRGVYGQGFDAIKK